MYYFHYHHLKPTEFHPPKLASDNNVRVAIILEAVTESNFRDNCIDWLITQPCFYVLTWGKDCELWEDVFDEMLVMYNIENETDKFVLTTSHPSDTVDEFINFVMNFATHPTVEITQTLILHIANQANKFDILQLFNKIQGHQNETSRSPTHP